MASVIDRAAHTLATLNVPHSLDGDEIVVPAASADGFDVRLQMLNDRSFVVMFERWRQDFDRPEDAYDCFEYGLSDCCRLKVVYRGAVPEAWQVQKREFGMWTPGHAVTRRSWAFWKPRRIEYRQNRVFKATDTSATETRGHEDARRPGV
jgi:hypothetical protein